MEDMKKDFKKIILLSIFLLFFFLPLKIKAQATPSARLYFLPKSGSFEVGQIISVRFAVNTGGNPINLVEANLSFSNETLEAIGFSKSGSIINLWFNEPSFSNSDGTIYFSGGIPNPGFTGIGRIIIINFKAKKAGSAWIKVSQAQVLANDGFGTNILSSTDSANFDLYKSGLPQPTQPPPIEGEIKVRIFSSTHPDENKWYQGKNIILGWDWQPGIIDYSYLLDQKPETIPDNSGEGLSTSTAYLNVSDGIWYFHLKAKTKDGWQKTNHFRIQIDSISPTDLKISCDEGEITFNPSPTIRFSAKDDLSGIDHFTIKINEKEIFETKENYFQLPKQKPGKIAINVSAFDKAGNFIEDKILINISPIPIPQIAYWTKELLVGETIGSLIIKGNGIAGTKIKFYLVNNFGKTDIYETEVKENGEWRIVVHQLLLPGKYSGYATAVIADEESLPSKTVEILIKKSGLRFLFWIIPPEIIWLLIIVLICALGILFTLYLGIKRKFKKCDTLVKKILKIKQKGNSQKETNGLSKF